MYIQYIYIYNMYLIYNIMYIYNMYLIYIYIYIYVYIYIYIYIYYFFCADSLEGVVRHDLATLRTAAPTCLPIANVACVVARGLLPCGLTEGPLDNVASHRH